MVVISLVSCNASDSGVKIGPEDIIIQEDPTKKEKEIEEKNDPKVDHKVITRKDTAQGVRKKIEELRELLDSFTVRGDRIEYEEMNTRDSVVFAFLDLLMDEEQPSADVKTMRYLMSKIDSLDRLYIELSKQIPEKEFRNYDDSLYTIHSKFLKKIKKEKKERLSGFKSWERGTAHLRNKKEWQKYLI